MVQDEVRIWFEVLRGRRGRSRTRKPDTIRGYIYYALPHLVAWSQTYQSLREVTRDDVKGILASMTGHDRSHTLSSCRSLFGTLKKHRVIFRNPTARLSAGTGDRTVPLPLPDDELIAIATDATGPERRLLFVLAPIQALRATQMRQLRRDDIDVGNRRLSVNGHVRPLDDATLKALSVYLRHRRDRWPLSTNPHLLVSQQTAYEDGPISSYWIKKRWRGMTASLERIRRDRQVDELLATGPDPLHFMAVFGSSATTATLYADAVADMLTTTIEHVTISTTSDTD